MAGPTLMQAVQERLASADPRMRIEGCLRVLALNDVRAIEQVLLEASQRDANADVRTVAGRALNLLREWTILGGKRPEVPAAAEKVAAKFRELLSNPGGKVRLGALTKVLKYKDPSLLPLVEEAMNGEQVAPVLAAMVAVLGQMGHERHLASVVACLHHPDPRVAAGAVAAAGQLGRDAVLPLLPPLLSHEDARVLAATLEVMRVHDAETAWKTLEGWADSDRVVRRQAVLATLSQVEDARGVAVAKKLLAVETDEDLKQSAQEYVDRVGASETPGGTPDVLDRLRNGLGSPDALSRRRAIDEAREHLAHPEVRALVQVLAQLDADKEVQRAAKAVLEEDLAELVQLSAVEQQRPDASLTMTAEELAARQEKVQAKFRNLLSRRQERMRMKAVLKAKKYHEKALLPVIQERMETETSPVVLAAMLATLADMGSDDLVPLLAPFLAHPNYRVVNGAVLALHRLGGDDVLPLFLPLLARDDPRILSQALIAVMRLNAEQLLDYVRQMAASPREPVRAAAITCLGRIPLPRVEEVARDMLEREAATAQINRLVTLLTERAGPSSAGPLFTLKGKRPELERQINQILDKVMERSGLSIEDIRTKGDEWAKSQELALAARQKELAARPRNTKRELALPEPPKARQPRWMAPFAFAGLVGLFYLVDWSGFGTPVGPNGPTDSMAHLQNSVWLNSAPKPKPVIDLPPTMSSEALAGVVAQQVDTPPKLTRDQTVSWHKALLKKQGYTNDEYIEMKSRGQWRDPFRAAYAEWAKAMGEKDYESAMRILEDALAATEPENIEVRQEIYGLLAKAAIKAGKPDKAKDAMHHSVELATKIAQIKAATKNPFGTGNLATPEEVAQLKGAGAEMDTAVETQAKHPDYVGGVPPDEIRKALKEKLEKLKAEGKVDDRKIAEVTEDLERRLAKAQTEGK